MIWLVVGVATIYAQPFVGEPLYCGGRYDNNTAPWVAVDVRAYESGQVHCGDLLWLQFADGSELQARAMDAGPFAGYYVEQWGQKPIVVDVPAHLAPFEGLSAPVTLVNLSAAARELEARCGR